MRIPGPVRAMAGFTVVAVIAIGAFVTRHQWLPLLAEPTTAAEAEEPVAPVEEPKVLKLSPQAQKNLGLVSRPLKLQTWWQKVQIPGVIVDRPGRSDRGITSPVVGVVTQVHAFPGDTVKPGDKLFTLNLFSEYLQKTQKELFAATRETELVQAQLKRLQPLADSGGIARAKVIDLENQIQRQQAAIEAHRQDLLTRGLSPQQIGKVSEGRFVSTIDVVAPPHIEESRSTTIQPVAHTLVESGSSELAYEVQSLAAELGQQVQAGQLLSTLANHRSLYIEGHAFKREAAALENAAQNGWPLDVEFAEDVPEHWPPLDQQFRIRHLANSIDTGSRTFDFYVPLRNQSRHYEQEGQTFIVWRFRPGQRVRLHVPVRRMDNVIVVPAEAVVREGPEAFLFRQNGDLFNRVPVQVLHEDRLHMVLASDKGVRPGLFFAQNAAASLNRVLKAQAASGVRADVHVHADGTVHAAH